MKMTRDKIASLIQQGDDGLLAKADAARRAYCGEAIHLRGIVEFSNVCDRNCRYCGLRRENTALPRYTMRADEIRCVAAEAQRHGVRTLVLQSGESEATRAEWLAGVIAAVKEIFDGAVTLCVGAKRPDCYRMWRRAGADRYLIKHETANRQLYDRLHPDSRLSERLAALEHLRRAGYQIGLGNIIGLPGQTTLDIADDLLLARDRDVDMASFGPFVPHPGTPLADCPPGELAVTLRVLALARLLLGPVHLPATTALDAIAPDGRERALHAGANVIMADLTPLRYRSLYDIYPAERAADSLENVIAIIERTGRPLAADCGHTLKHRSGLESCERLQKV